jgi:predicted AAA+ superfamily ATPase
MHQELVASLHAFQLQAASLLIYRDVLAGEPGQSFLRLLQTLADRGAIVDISMQSAADRTCLLSYGQWFQAMAVVNRSWQDYLIDRILTANNPFTQLAQTKEFSRLPHDLIAAVRHDLKVLHNLSYAGGDSLHQWLQTAIDLPFDPVIWHGSQAAGDPHTAHLWNLLRTVDNWAEVLSPLAAHYRQYGTGLFARYMALRWQTGELVGIAHPDLVQIANIVGYDLQKEALLKNTDFFLAGARALHVLLYGSRGSGKSSLVKSLLLQYGDRGLRLIEVAKSDLKDLSQIVEKLRHAPQKFIIFVDDLSFEQESEDYKALKVLLEGNLTARPPNVLVYATSNRRHLLREYFSERPRPSDGDEVHPWDTVQEKLSLSDRFGLTITFAGADQHTYLQIVTHLAAQANIDISSEDLEYRALQWATRHNGRSGRTAQQFIDFLQAELASKVHPLPRGT